MNSLLIDTTNDTLVVAIKKGNKVFSKSYQAEGEHSCYVMLGLEALFKEADLKPTAINKLMIVNGPGSWTGIRIGVTIGKVYGWALKPEIIPISSLHAYALAYTNYDYYVVALAAHRDFIYVGIYNQNYQPLLPDSYINIKELEEVIDNLKGTVAVISNINNGRGDSYQELKLEATAVINYYENKRGVTYTELKPNYVKNWG